MKIQFQLSDKAIQAYLTQDQEKAKKQEINVSTSDLSTEQIKLLTATTDVAEAREGIVTLKFKTNSFSYNIDGVKFDVRLGELNSTDINEILVEVQEAITAAHEKHIEQEDRKKKEEDERVSEEEARRVFNELNIQLFLQGKDAHFKSSPYSSYLWKGDKAKSDNYYFCASDLVTMFADLKVEIEFEITRRAIVEERRIEAVEKEKQAKESAACEWALQYGSDLLKSRIVNGFEWKELAEKEWLQATYPELIQWADLEEDSSSPLKTPELEQLRELEAFKAKYPTASGVTLDKVTDIYYGTFTVVSGTFEGFFDNYLLTKTID